MIRVRALTGKILKYFVVIIISSRAWPIVGFVTCLSEIPSDSLDSEECSIKLLHHLTKISRGFYIF